MPRRWVKDQGPAVRILQLAAAVAMLGALACGRWGATTAPVRVTVLTAANQAEPRPIRVTLANGDRVELTEPGVAGDSIVGTVEGDVRRAIPIADIRAVERWSENSMANGLLLWASGLAVSVGVGVAIAAAFASIIG